MNLENNNSGPLSFGDLESVQSFKNMLFKYFEKSGLDPYITGDWKKGIFELFGVQTVNLPDLNSKNYILASNHISDFDGIILGLLHPKIRIVAKMGWISDKELFDFLKLHYDIVGVYRSVELDKLNGEEKKEAEKHNYNTLKDFSNYLKNTDKSQEARHLLVFPQGTISDINKNSKERVNSGFSKIAYNTKASVINIFTEYPGFGKNTRIVCGNPYDVTERGLDYSRIWLDDVINLQNKLDNLRSPVFSEKHSNNNNPGDPFF